MFKKKNSPRAALWGSLMSLINVQFARHFLLCSWASPSSCTNHQLQSADNRPDTSHTFLHLIFTATIWVNIIFPFFRRENEVNWPKLSISNEKSWDLHLACSHHSMAGENSRLFQEPRQWDFPIFQNLHLNWRTTLLLINLLEGNCYLLYYH